MQNPPKVDAPSGSRHSPKNDQLQVFIGNIPHSASEEGIRKMFSKFGNLTRIRLHTNPRKEWLPRYAFISYENIHAVRQCLMKKVSIFCQIIIYFDFLESANFFIIFSFLLFDYGSF